MSSSVALKFGEAMPRGGLKAWFVCLSAGLFFLYEFFQLNIFDVINLPLRHDFNLSAAQISWMSSTYLWADIIFLLPAGLILDRFSTRTVILFSMFVCIIGTVGFALTNSFVLACLFHFFSGIGNAFCFLSCVVLISHWFPSRRQAFVIGSVVTMAFLGGMIAHTPFAHLNDYYGWRHSLLIVGAIGVVLFIWIYLIVQDKPDSTNHQKNVSAAALSSFLAAFKNPQTWLAGLYTSFLNLPIMILCALWGASYLQVVHHLSAIAASNVVSLIFIGSIIGCPAAGLISDSHGKRKPVMLGGAVATLIALLPLFLPVQLSQAALSIIFFALGFLTSTQVISYPLIAESNQEENTGAATGIASVLIMGGGGVGQVLFGWLMQQHASSGLAEQQYSAADFQFAMWVFPITAVITLLILYFTRETNCQRLELKNR